MVALLDVELAATPDGGRKADLLIEKGMALDGELLDVPGARAAFQQALELRKGDAMASEALDELGLAEKNWQKFAAKYLQEATASTDRSRWRRHCWCRRPSATYGSSPRRSRPRRTCARRSTSIRRTARRRSTSRGCCGAAQRWDELGELLDRSRRALGDDRGEGRGADRLVRARERDRSAIRRAAEQSIRRVLALDPAHPRALRIVTDAAAAANDWPAVVAAYQAALKVRRDGDDLGMLLQIAMVLWKHLGDLDGAEEYFRRIRKVEPAHPAALDFYRAYYTAKGETGKLMSMLKAAEKGARAAQRERRARSICDRDRASSPRRRTTRRRRSKPGSSTCARIRRRAQARGVARAAVSQDREVERAARPDEGRDRAAAPRAMSRRRVAKLFEVVEIYRDRLRLDVMVINTYNAILKLDPDNLRATDELAGEVPRRSAGGTI